MKKSWLMASIGMLVAASCHVAMAHTRDDRGEAGRLFVDRGVVAQQRVWVAGKDNGHGSGAAVGEPRGQARDMRRDDGFDDGMRAVPTAAGPGEPGDGWLYFSDPAAHRAVVISPQGEYFLSRGHGLRLVATAQPRP
ncbi:MAG: hypothetical protein WCS60_08190 [Hydrogenophaga sp.]